MSKHHGKHLSATREERQAWDRYAAAWTVALGFTHAERRDGEEDPATAAEYADAMLAERRKRFEVDDDE